MGEALDVVVDRTSGAPLGTQLVDQVRTAVSEGRLKPGDRLPSVRELSHTAGVNVNTVRAVYARLEAEGLVRSEHGRGTFVAGADLRAARANPTRNELREQITALEATLARLPPPPLAAGEGRGGPAAALLSTDELLEVRDRLLERLQQLDTERTALLESLEQLGLDAPEPAGARGEEEPASRRDTPSLAGARIRWVGA
jgi:DNA-binding transcriptional regulator YhcF (GntR family)